MPRAYQLTRHQLRKIIVDRGGLQPMQHDGNAIERENGEVGALVYASGSTYQHIAKPEIGEFRGHDELPVPVYPSPRRKHLLRNRRGAMGARRTYDRPPGGLYFVGTSAPVTMSSTTSSSWSRPRTTSTRSHTFA